MNTVDKKCKVSKKTKKSWRLYIGTKDIDNYFNNVRLEERLGTPFFLRKNEDLFIIDEKKDNNFDIIQPFTKQEYRKSLNNKKLNCYATLKTSAAVSDTIVKGNHIKSQTEGKNSILKKIKITRKLNNNLKLKQKVMQNRLKIQENSENQIKKECFNIDIWGGKFDEFELKNKWLTNNTKRHILAYIERTQKRVPESLYKKLSVLPAVTVPHPGISYNPSYVDHQKLLTSVANDEIKVIKQEKHLDRVTNKMFLKVTLKQKNNYDLKEMCEGLSIQEKNNVSNDEDSDPNIKSINPPVKNIKKTLVQRRKKKEQQKLQQQLLKEKNEKKKIADIYHLYNLKKQIFNKEKKEAFLQEKRIKHKVKKKLEPKVLSRHKYEPIEQEFQLRDELTGNLRNTQPTGNLLKDRYKSFQQRNIIAPSMVVLKQEKTKVKRFIKADHKINFKNTLK